MSLIPYDSWFDYDRVFDQFFAPARWAADAGGVPGWMSPKVDIHELADHYEITAELPGLKKEDVNVNLHDGVLTIDARTSNEKVEEKEGKVIRKERYNGQYLRRFNLGPDIKDNAIAASFADGVLKVEVKKPAPEAPQPKRIDIK